VTVRRDAVQQCHAEGKRPLNASWKRKKLLTGPDRSDGWDGTGAPDWTVADRPFVRIFLPPPRPLAFGHLTTLASVTGSHSPTK